MEETHKAIMVVSSLAAVVLMVVGVFLCSWIWKRTKKKEEDEEEILRKDYVAAAAAELSPESGAASPMYRISPTTGSAAAEGSASASSHGGQHRAASSSSSVLGGRKIFQLDRPKREMMAEHMQTDPDSHTSLKQQLAIKDSPTAVRDYRATGITKQNSITQADRQGGNPSGTSTSGSTTTSSNSNNNTTSSNKNASNSNKSRSMWRNVKNMASKLMEVEDPQELEEQATEAIVDGVDYKLGKIQIALMYDFQTLTLTLRVIRAVDLPPKDVMGTSDPYVRILLLPDKKHKLMTKVKKRNLNPHWNECFLFEGWPHNKLLDKTVYLQVIDYDRFSRDDPIGETYIPLNEIDLSQGTECWKYLQPCKETRGKLGELLLSLCYQPNIGRLTIIVMKAKELKAKDITGSSDPYVKMWLHFGATRVEKKKTSIKMANLNPVFNESFIFEIPWEKIREASLEVSVMDFDRVGRNELIGKVMLGCRSASGPMETRHWNDMVAKPRQQVAQWHLLKD